MNKSMYKKMCFRNGFGVGVVSVFVFSYLLENFPHFRMP